MSTRILYARIKYSMYDLVCDVISCCVWSCVMGKINVHDKIVMKKEKIWKPKKCIHKSPSIRRFWNRIYCLLMRADARGRSDTIYCMWRISLFCGPGIVNDVTKVGHAQAYFFGPPCIPVYGVMRIKKWYKALSISSLRFIKLWIPFVNYLLDGNSCKKFYIHLF